MFGLRAPELLLIIVALVLLFGASRLPQLAKSLGQSRKAFKEGMREAEEEDETDRAKLSTSAPAPQITQMSDDELAAEMRRRSQAKQV